MAGIGAGADMGGVVSDQYANLLNADGAHGWEHKPVILKENGKDVQWDAEATKPTSLSQANAIYDTFKKIYGEKNCRVLLSSVTEPDGKTPLARVYIKKDAILSATVPEYLFKHRNVPIENIKPGDREKIAVTNVGTASEDPNKYLMRCTIRLTDSFKGPVKLVDYEISKKQIDTWLAGIVKEKTSKKS